MHLFGSKLIQLLLVACGVLLITAMVFIDDKVLLVYLHFTQLCLLSWLVLFCKVLYSFEFGSERKAGFVEA